MKAIITLLVLGIVFLNSGLTFAKVDEAKAYDLFQKKKYKESRDLYKKMCFEEKLDKGCINYGVLLSWTDQIEEAFPIYQRYCLKDERISCGFLGFYYELKEDWYKSALFYKKSCKDGLKQSCERLGKLASIKNLANAL